MGEKAQGIRSLNSRRKNSQGEVKNTIGNGETKELTYTTHGYKLRLTGCWWEAGCRAEGNKREN